MAAEESGGAGGKYRKKSSKRTQTTPYARPPSAFRATQFVGAVERGNINNSWLSKLVDPASRLITAGAHKLFSSVFRKRLLPPPPPPDETAATGDVQPESTTRFTPSGTKDLAVCSGGETSRPSVNGGVADLEEILKQKTFTRSEIDHLTALLLSRTDDNTSGDEKGRLETNVSAEKAIHTRREILTNIPALENGAERVLPAAISTPVMSSKVLEDVVASPAELAKAYMGSRPTRASPSVFGVQNEMPTEDLSAPYNPFKPKSPAMSLMQKPASEIRVPTNGFMTPRFRGRSAIYSMARTPYSRPPSAEVFKAANTALNFHGASSSSHNAAEIQQLSGSKSQVLKRRSSVLESDIGSVGPIRRIRQKPNLLHHKTLSTPVSGAPHVRYGSGASTNVTEVPSWNSGHRSPFKALAEKGMPSTSNGYVPTQSIEMAQKIFQELDKFTSKGKSSEKKIDVVGESSPGKLTSDSRGLAYKTMNTLDSSKILKSNQGSQKENGLLHSNAHDHPLKISPRIEKDGIKKSVIPCVEDGAEVGKPSESSVYMNPQSNINHQQKKRAFQMSAHEDYLELDDDTNTNGVASTPMIKGVEGHELATAAFSENPLQSAAISAGKPSGPEAKPATILSGASKEESLPDRSAAVQKFTGLTFPLTSSTTSLSTQAAVSSPQSTAEMDRVAGQSERINEKTVFNSNSAKVAPFRFSPPSSTFDSGAATSSATGAADRADGPDKTEKKSTSHFEDVSKKLENAPSVSSSAKGGFTFGLPSNGATLSNGLPCSTDQSPVPVPVSSPVFSLPNGNGVPTSISTSILATSAGTMTNTAIADSMGTFGSISSHSSTSLTAPSASSVSNFQFGSPAISSSSTTAATSSKAVTTSGTEVKETAFGNASIGHLSAKPDGIASFGNNMSGFNASTFKKTSFETQTAGPAVTSGSIFGLQASSSSVAATTSSQSFSTQSVLSASSQGGFGNSGPASDNASVSVSTVANPFTSSSASASTTWASSSQTTPVSSSSNTASNIFGWPSSKPTAPGSVFGTSSQSTGISFGLAASETCAPTNSTPIVFGANSSSSAASNSAPFVFGSGPTAAASVFAVPSAAATPASVTPFSPQPTFGSPTPQAFGFGMTPPVGNNDRMSMEDSMAEDSVQVSTPAAPVFSTPIPAPSSSFVFGGAAPSTGNPFQFGGQQNPIAPQSTPFQPTGSLEFNAGGAGSFSLGSGGGDKSNRRIVKVKNRIRRK